MTRTTHHGLACLLLCLALAALPGAAPGQHARGIALTEERLALVIGNADYRRDPLDNPVNDARLMAKSLRQAGFAVALHENLDRVGLFEALRAFGGRLNENTIAVIYYAGHGLQLSDHNYLVPVDAEIRSEDEIPIAGLDVGYILGRMANARSRVNIVILDACRNNPFRGKNGAKAQGLAQMDAPVGTLLAYATAPGKLAADSGSAGGVNSLYATHLARQLLVPGLPVERVFKKVREAVVQDTREEQVPWESSSLQGEFAFVPGAAAPPEAPGEGELAVEWALWQRVRASTRAEDFRDYVRQYPSGRFVEVAQLRLNMLTAPAAAPLAPVDNLPHVGDTWRYRVQDQFRIGDIFLTATIDGVSAQGVAETWTTTYDAKLRTTRVPLDPGFNPLPDWTLTPPEFAPYLLAAGGLRPGTAIPDQSVGQMPLRVLNEGEEDVLVGAGRFRATKLVLRGQTASRGAGRGKPMTTEHVIWYAPQVKRTVKYTVATRVGNDLRDSTTFELMQFTLH